MTDATHLLLPRPQKATLTTGSLTLSDRPIFTFDNPATGEISRRLSAALTKLGFLPRVATIDEQSIADIRLELDASGSAESYSLEIGSRGVRIRGADLAGLSYGVATLVQWLRIHLRKNKSDERVVPALTVEDRPDFRHRGVLLDISRDKVPTLATLRQLIDLLADWKINQLQLYMEHTFAYSGHEDVWKEASPLTAEDVRELDAYCRSRCIELVPNQNSFGHFHRWLIHEPYRRLAETPNGIEHPFSFEREPFSLCPIDPGSSKLLAELYDQLLPCFTSSLFNVGLDETFDLGFGRSAQACADRGQGRVYLDFLQSVYRLVSERGKKMLFWGDVILKYPELLEELPDNAIALEWGYDAGHPFAEDTLKFQASGLDFYVCPGTSSWNTFAGRTRNAIENLASAAVLGQDRGALGYLITDWGDNGHLQPLPVSYSGLAAGASFAWNATLARDPQALPLSELLDLHAFRDSAAVMGQVATGLGNAYLETNPACINGSALFFMLIFAHKKRQERRGEGLSVDSLERTVEKIESAISPLDSCRMQRSDAELVSDEMSWIADILRFSCRLGRAWIDTDLDRPLSALPRPTRTRLSVEMDALIERHREIWLARNRPGGLERSAMRLQRVQRLLAE